MQVTIVLAGRNRSVEPSRVGKAPGNRLWVGRETSRLWMCCRVRVMSIMAMQRDLSIERGCSGGHAVNGSPEAGCNVDLLNQ